MDNEQALRQARMIFTTGKMFRDRVIRSHWSQIVQEGQLEGYMDLSLTQMHAIMVTRDEGEVTISRLAELLGVSAPSASAMVERLVEKSALLREHSREDRRKVVVRLSPQAAKGIEKMEANMLRLFADLVAKIGPDNARKWCEALEKVREVLARGDWGDPGRTREQNEVES